jgi:LPXTG-site transpeptidase (sortase) family protein
VFLCGVCVIRKRYLVSGFIISVLAGALFFVNGSTRTAYSEQSKPVHGATKMVDRGNSDVVSRTSAAKTPQSSPSPEPAAPSPRATVTASMGGDTLSIPSIGLVAPIVRVGVTATNAIDVPPGLEVGHWTGSAQPGSAGATFLDGHVDGIFAHLHKVQPGQAFRVSYGGQIYHYRVVHTETVALDGIDMNRALNPYGSSHEGLNIMTCAGRYIDAIGTYDHRFVVYAVRV